MLKTVILVIALITAMIVPITTTEAQTTIPRVSIGTSMTVGGQTFTPRGANYIRLTSDGASTPYWYISTFEPGLYNPSAVRNMLSQLTYDKYNVVRTFIDIGNERTDGQGSVHGMGHGMSDNRPVNPEYMDNFADFVKAANERNIYVIPVLYRIPQNCYYYTIVQNGGQCAVSVPTVNVEGRNALYMDKGHVAAKVEYLKQFSSALVARIGNTAGVLAYASDNEAYFEANKAPFASKTGSVVNSDGKTYSMVTNAGRQAAADQGLYTYTTRVREGLRAGDPNGKLTIGLYTLYAIGKTKYDGLSSYCSTNCIANVDYRYPVRGKFANVDIIDVHFYPRNANTGYTVQADLNTTEYTTWTKPWFTGEIGAHRDFFNNDIVSAAFAMRDAQTVACQLGSKGSLFWTVDNQDNADQQRLFTLMENGGAINGVLAPIANPTFC
jgi:hypothetical protein